MLVRTVCSCVTSCVLRSHCPSDLLLFDIQKLLGVFNISVFYIDAHPFFELTSSVMTTDVGVVVRGIKTRQRGTLSKRGASLHQMNHPRKTVPLCQPNLGILIDHIATCCQPEGRRAGERGRQWQPQYCVCVLRRELGQKTIQEAVKLFRGMTSVRNIHSHESQSCASFLTCACTWRIHRQRWTRAWPTNAV